MNNETAEYILTMQDGSQIKFKTTLPGEYMNLFLKENHNIWNESKFIAFVNSFQKTIFKYKLYML